MSELPEGAVPFDHPTWNRRRGDWGFYQNGDHFISMSDLVGKVVNVGTKDGVVYDTAMVTAFRDTGLLVLDLGRKGTIFNGAADMDGPEEIHCHEIARGYVHPDGPR